MKCMIQDLIGENCITQQSGQTLCDLIQPQLQAGQPVELDFTGVKRFLSVFFNFAIGQLLQTLDSDTFDRLLIVSNLTPVGQQTYDQVVSNAKRHYALDENQQTIIDSIVVEQAALL
jgi:STAS-like domain of unknown function (DUF4325)